MRIQSIVMVSIALLGLTACQTRAPYRVSGEGAVIHEQRTCHRCGYVVDVDRVEIADDRIGLGAVIGAVVGAAAGHQVGDGSGQDLATAAGAIGGAVAGHNIEKQRRQRDIGYRFEVELDDGRYAVVTQYEHHGIDRGDRVRLRGDELFPI